MCSGIQERGLSKFAGPNEELPVLRTGARKREGGRMPELLLSSWALEPELGRLANVQSH